jgi:hypothetical protein
LKPVCNQIQKVNELAEDEGFCGRVLHAQIAELLDEGLDLRRGSPRFQVKTTKDTLACGTDIFLQIDGRPFEVNGEGEVTYWALRLQEARILTENKIGQISLNLLLASGREVVLDTLPVENVSASRPDCIFGSIIAKPANNSFPLVGRYELGPIRFASKNQVGMTCHLPHPSKTKK